MSDIDQRLREAMDGVTPGPWKLHGTLGIDCEIGARKNPAIATCVPNFVQDGSVYANAAYIALCSPDNIGALLDTIASLRSKLEEAEGALEKCQRVLAMMTDGKMSKPSVVSAFAQCVEAELAARRTLASLREADHA